MLFNIDPKHLILNILLLSISSSSFALPATQATATDVLKASQFDQTIQHYQTRRLAQRYSQSLLQNIPANDLVEDKTYYENKIEQQLLTLMHSQDFNKYYIQRLIQPYLKFYQEEELVHLLNIYEHPLALDFFKQNLKSIQDQQDQSYSNAQIKKDQQLEQQIIELLEPLTSK
ncbi:hypothetical protein [Acinetobacter gyllenbergii]|uniref:hypothetical protein n=1 Tax=Acinetobacter gyllenbergii TaxID=134534 RepID=UPI003F553254